MPLDSEHETQKVSMATNGVGHHITSVESQSMLTAMQEEASPLNIKDQGHQPDDINFENYSGKSSSYYESALSTQVHVLTSQEALEYTQPPTLDIEILTDFPNKPASSDSVSDSKCSESEPRVQQNTVLFENPLQRELDDEIHQQAAQVIQEVSGSRREANADLKRPFDPNLVCPMCRKQFRIGEIQRYRRHVNTCTGTSDD